jgi:hypothetical protein
MVFSDDAHGQRSSGGAGQRPPVATGASEGGPAPIPASPPVAVVTGRGIHGRRRAGQRPPAVATTGTGEGSPASHPRPLLRWRRRVRDPRSPERRPAATSGGDGCRRGQPRTPIPGLSFGGGDDRREIHGCRTALLAARARLVACCPSPLLHACHRRSSRRRQGECSLQGYV